MRKIVFIVAGIVALLIMFVIALAFFSHRRASEIGKDEKYSKNHHLRVH